MASEKGKVRGNNMNIYKYMYMYMCNSYFVLIEVKLIEFLEGWQTPKKE